jgi:hypothetical protein
VIVGIVGALSGAPLAGATAHRITWLAAGDSYASGAGLADTTACGRAAGSSEAWATVAATALAPGVPIASPQLVACSGAPESEFFAPRGLNPAEWTPRAGRFDLVTFSFGGDDVGFTRILEECLARQPTCSDDAVHPLITAVGTSSTAFLVRVANRAVVSGGNVVVMGYPDLFETPGRWPATNLVLDDCAGMTAADATLIRTWAADLDSALRTAVGQANALGQGERNRVRFTFVDPVTGTGDPGVTAVDTDLFEPAGGPRHELCSQEPWINGILPTTLDKSFHPDQAGEDALGDLAATVISHLHWPRGTRGPVLRLTGPGI